MTDGRSNPLSTVIVPYQPRGGVDAGFVERFSNTDAGSSGGHFAFLLGLWGCSRAEVRFSDTLMLVRLTLDGQMDPQGRRAAQADALNWGVVPEHERETPDVYERIWRSGELTQGPVWDRNEWLDEAYREDPQGGSGGERMG